MNHPPIECPTYDFAGDCPHMRPDARTAEPKKDVVEDIMNLAEIHCDRINQQGTTGLDIDLEDFRKDLQAYIEKL